MQIDPQSLTIILYLWAVGLGCLMCTIFLLSSRNLNRMRIQLAVILAITGVWSIIHTYQFLQLGYEIINPFSLYSSFSRNFTFYLFALCVPMEVIRPGFWTINRIIKVVSPYLLWIALFVTLKGVGAVVPVYCDKPSDIVEFSNMFDVWGGRIIPYLMSFGVQLYVMRLYYKHLPAYKTYVEMNYADCDYFNERWLNVSVQFNLVMLITYYIAISTHSIREIILHSVVFFILIIYQTMQALNLKIVANMNDLQMLKSEQNHPPFSTNPEEGIVPNSPPLFSEGEELELLRQAIEAWIIGEKPYLRTTFQQLDVMEKFGISRYMATKVFRDAFASSFADYVHDIRIEESCKLMQSHPEIAISEIAEMVGYSSPSVFSRAFAKYKKTSPSAWRNNR